ncbi:TetR/AcrR family transcriptional regulator [Paenibacillus rigui]|nr:TetR/AcrR family transcriptional regulator [Paenibacillus rigui]
MMKQEAKEDVKQKILDGAKHLFARKGFEGTTVRQICDEAGVALALVSYHFGGKENVFYALFDSLEPGLLKETYDLTDPESDFRKFILEFVRFRMSEPELINILQQEVMMQSPRLEKLQEVMFPVWLLLRNILQAGKEQGQFQFESLKHTMYVVVGTLVYSRTSSFLEPLLESIPGASTKESFEEVVAYTTQYILNGLQRK